MFSETLAFTVPLVGSKSITWLDVSKNARDLESTNSDDGKPVPSGATNGANFFDIERGFESRFTGMTPDGLLLVTTNAVSRMSSMSGMTMSAGKSLPRMKAFFVIVTEHLFSLVHSFAVGPPSGMSEVSF